MSSAEGRIDGCIAYRSMIRYDAYGEMSGQQSSAWRCSTRTAPGSWCRPSSSVTRPASTSSRCGRATSEMPLSPEEQEAIATAADRAHRRRRRGT